MYRGDQIKVALELYHQCGSVTKTIRTLGYPSRRALYGWINSEGKPKKQRKKSKRIHTKEHPLNPSVEVKIDALRRCFELGESVKSVAEDIGYTKSSIFAWRKKYLREGAVALMSKRTIRRGPLKEGSGSADKEIADLKAQLFDLQLEIDILKEMVTVIKKDPGVDRTTLKNREKAVIVDALKNRYSLPLLLKKLCIAKSCYYYQRNAFKSDKYETLRSRIKEVFKETRECYGYRRIYAQLIREGYRVSEKVIRRIMREEALIINNRRRRGYNSYKGEISPEVPNVIERNFHADKPNQKWLTDITEFSIPAGKVYLSPLVDCFDGLLPSWTISTRPDSVLVNTMLDDAITRLNANEHPIVHSDRGSHYRWPGFIERMEKAGLTRSMSMKGCNTYLIWYNEKRIKVSLGNMSPKEYRQSLGLAGY